MSAEGMVPIYGKTEVLEAHAIVSGAAKNLTDILHTKGYRNAIVSVSTFGFAIYLQGLSKNSSVFGLSYDAAIDFIDGVDGPIVWTPELICRTIGQEFVG